MCPPLSTSRFDKLDPLRRECINANCGVVWLKRSQINVMCPSNGCLYPTLKQGFWSPRGATDVAPLIRHCLPVLTQRQYLQPPFLRKSAGYAVDEKRPTSAMRSGGTTAVFMRAIWRFRTEYIALNCSRSSWNGAE